MEKSRAVVEMVFSDGSALSAWTSFSLLDNYANPLGALEFTAQPPRARHDEYRQRLAKGQRVGVKINGIPQGDFIVQTLDTTIAMDGVTFKVSCNTPLVTAFEGHVDPDLAFHSQTDVPVTDVILQALAPYGFDRIIADSSANVDAITGKPRDGKKPKINVEALKHQDAQAHPRESAYNFCSRIFSRLGVCLRVAADGTLLIGSPDYDQSTSYTVAQTFGVAIADADYMLAGIQVHDTNAGQFSSCTVRGAQADKKGQKQTNRPSATVATTALNQARPPYFGADAGPKPLYIVDKNARDLARAQSVAKLALGIRAKDAFVVTHSVDGMLSKTGRLWQVDTVGRVVIDAYGLDQKMWLLERTFTMSAQGSQTTQLKWIPLGFLVLGDEPS